MNNRADVRTACATFSSTFRHPLLEDAPTNLSQPQRKLQALLAARACALCANCPVSRKCLYDAVVRFDVAGIVASTTPMMREAIRDRLGWHVEPDGFDALLGVTSGQRVEHNEIVRARRSNPNESLGQLAERLGCSLSTVKRHLRQERTGDAHADWGIVPPSFEQVEQALDDLLAEKRTLKSQLAKAA